MFDQVFESFRKATETTVQMQQEMYKKWIALWPGLPTSSVPPALGDQVQQFQKKGTELIQDFLKRQREFTGTQFKVGLENIDRAFKLGEAKSADELRTKTLELWQKCFENLRQVYESQLADFRAMLDKWVQVAAKPAA